MRALFLLLYSLAAVLCYGQQQSRIVFFRMDAEVGSKSSSLAEWRAYTDALMKDGATIAAMRSNTVFIHTTSEPRGSYFLVPAVSGKDYSNRLNLPELNGGIVFVKIVLSDNTPITAHLEQIEFADFENCYRQVKWLRKRLKDEGFSSVQQLIQGFSIPSQNPVAGSRPTLSVKRKLNDTVFFSKNQRRTDREYAASYSIATEDSGGMFLIQDYYLPNSEIKSRYHFQTLDSDSREGWSQEFFRSGRLSSRGNYRSNRKEDRWEFYYDTLSSPKWYTCYYTNGIRNGMLTSYYVNGKLKREELHKLVSDTKDSIVSGRRYGPSGAEIPFTAFEILPKPHFDMSKFLSKTLRYPKDARENGNQGRVIVQFTIDKSGSIRDAVIVKHAYEDLDQEALRVVNLMPAWNAGLQDDAVVDVSFTLPVTFRLD